MREPVVRVIGIGFAAGSAVHAAAFLLMGLGLFLYGTTYPAWRHVVMAAVDAGIAWIAWRRPAWLLAALAAWVLEQTLTNGVEPFSLLVVAAMVALAIERRRTRRCT
jgi:hypothetical protein